MAVRTGEQYVEDLRKKPREVWVGGRQVPDVTQHPAFVRPVQQIAKLYDLQHDPRFVDVLTCPSPTGEPMATAFLAPRTPQELRTRREAFRLFAESTLGMMGRSQDFLNTTVMALAEATDLFGRLGSAFAENIARYYAYVRDQDLLLTHALITPQIDRSRMASEQHDADLHMGVVDQTSDGLVVRGARMLATLAPMADELLIYSLPGLRRGDARHAAVFAIPIDTPGLRLICREPFDDGGRRPFDHPLSAHFEEPDALVVFNDVLVPWDRVFLHGNVELANAMYDETSLRHHTAHQTGVRGLVKLELVAGVCMAVSQAVRTDQFLHVQQLLGECVADVEVARALLLAAENDCEPTRWGTVRPRLQPLQTLRIVLARSYPRMIEILQTIGAGGLLMTPSAADFEGPIGSDILRYYQGAGGLPAVDRTRLYKLAWDLAGDAFGQRQLQYERYFAGDPVRLLAAHYLGYDSRECDSLVARALELAGDPSSEVNR